MVVRTESIRYTQYDTVAREVGRQGALKIARETTREVAFSAQREVPVDTGHLATTQRWNVEADINGATGTVRYTADYSMAVHSGARPHSITPRNPAGALRFRVGGRLIITKHVNHPGNRGNPWLLRALIKHGTASNFRVTKILPGR